MERGLRLKFTNAFWAAGLAAGLALVSVLAGWPVFVAAGFACLAAGLIAGVLWQSQTDQKAVARVETHFGANQSIDDLASVVALIELPAIALDDRPCAIAFNAMASDLFPNLEKDQPLAHISRHPDFLGAVELVSGDGLERVVEIVDHLPNGRRLRANVAPLNLSSPGSRNAKLFVQFRDLSEQDRLAQMRSDFIANASHELRTPLASLRGFIETLEGPASEDSAARKRFLSIMSAQAARMTRILDDLLSLSRIEMRAHVPPAGNVSVGAVLKEVCQGLEPLAREAGISINLDLPQTPLLQVRGERDELVQVFQNLVQNAIKYGRRGGRVDVSLTVDPAASPRRPRLLASVADDGPGIAAEHLPRLTERFYRVDTATSRERGGTGLGLAIVKHILNRHRGDLKISSEVGKGSKFTVSLDLSN